MKKKRTSGASETSSADLRRRSEEKLAAQPTDAVVVKKENGETMATDCALTAAKNERGEFTVYRGVICDITERKRVEEALKESWAKYEAVVESFDGLIYICSMDYKIEFMNRRYIERIGCNPIGQDCYRVLHNRDSVCPWCVNDSVLRGKTVRWELLNPKDNRWYYMVNTPITHPDGRVSKMAMIHDITERKQADDLLKRREAILEAIAFASERFMKKTAAWEQCVQDVLARLGQSTGVSSVYIFENHAVPAERSCAIAGMNGPGRVSPR